MYKVEIYILLFFIYSFMGWLMEMIVCNLGKKEIVNRGFLIGPICPIYGNGCLLIILLLKKYLDDPFALFVMAVLICSVLEYFTSWMMEKLFKARWWDYSEKKFNINGRICLKNCIGFGLLGILIMYIVNPFIVKQLLKLNKTLVLVVVIVLSVIYVVDNIMSLKVIQSFKKVAKTIHKDSTAEITKRVRKVLSEKGVLYRRLIKAFNVKVTENIQKKIIDKKEKRRIREEKKKFKKEQKQQKSEEKAEKKRKNKKKREKNKKK